MGYHARATQRSGRNRLGPRREFRNGAVSRQLAEKLGAVTDGRFSCCRLICSAFPFSSSICAAFLFSQFHLSSGATPSIRGRGLAPRMAALFFYFFFFSGDYFPADYCGLASVRLVHQGSSSMPATCAWCSTQTHEAHNGGNGGACVQETPRSLQILHECVR